MEIGLELGAVMLDLAARVGLTVDDRTLELNVNLLEIPSGVGF